ncbi:unnamed protein product [Ilex paraguariensis]|uniref:Early flowering 3 n=1 Tax=Ilex paraguariensis TaxID=185542 RepID=A0ABC8RLQ7_9AQUA
MKRGKDEEKIMGPMFPRLHVNDTEKGGPRAPPRNKMALYEQLSIPSQRFNPGVLPVNPNNNTNLVAPASSSQGMGHERSTPFPLQLSPSVHPVEKPQTGYCNLNTPSIQPEQKKKQDEDDFRVPIFVHSRMGQDHTDHSNSMGMEKLSPFSPAYLGSSMKLQNANDKEPKLSSSTGHKLRQEGRSESGENSNEFVAGRKHAVKSTSNMSSRENAGGSLKQTNASSSYECHDYPANNFSRLQGTEDSLGLECRHDSQPDNSVEKPLMVLANGNSSISMTVFPSEKRRSPNEPLNDMESCEERTCRSLQAGNVDRDDVSETSMVDSMSGLEISPDDVVEMIGQKHFWKARRAIAK